MSIVPDSLQIEPNARIAALEKCYTFLKRWRVALPPTEPLVMDFGLGQFERFGLIEFWIANEVQAGYCGKYMFVLNGQMCPQHSHQLKHETFFVVRGSLSVTLDDDELTLDEGGALAIEPGRVHSFAGKGAALMLELSMPCDPRDNIFEAPEAIAWLHRNINGTFVPT